MVLSMIAIDRFRVAIPQILQPDLEAFDRSFLQTRNDEKKVEISEESDKAMLALYGAVVCFSLHLRQSEGSEHDRTGRLGKLIKFIISCFQRSEWLIRPNIAFLQACM